MDNKVSNEEIVNDIIKDLNINENKKDVTLEEAKQTDQENSLSKTISENFVSDENISENVAQSTESTDSNTLEDIDDETLQKIEDSLSETDKKEHRQKALDLKAKGNEEFTSGNYLDSIKLYTKALNICPLSYKTERSIFYCNRAAAKIKLEYNEGAIDDCTKAIEFNCVYMKAYIRRAKLYETTDKLDESLNDYTKILELDPSNNEARAATLRLPPRINERNEKLKEEMFGKLKEFGNVILKPFGLSTDNFKMQQDPNTGSYSVNLQQTRKS